MTLCLTLSFFFSFLNSNVYIQQSTFKLLFKSTFKPLFKSTTLVIPAFRNHQIKESRDSEGLY